MRRFCPKCGSEEKILPSGLCEPCFWKSVLDGFPSQLSIIVCNSCYSHLQGKRWIRYKLPVDEDRVIRAAEEGLLARTELPSDVDLRLLGGKIEARYRSGLPSIVELEGEVVDRASKVSKKTKICVNVEYQQCNDCYCVASGKYDALVQVRAEGRKLDSLDIGTLEKVLQRFQKKVEGHVRPDITEIKEHEGGLDIKFLTVNAARTFVRELSDATGATVLESKRIVGLERITGSRHFRTTIAVKLPALRFDDLIEASGTIYRIRGYHRGRTVAEALGNPGKSLSLSRNLLAASRKIGWDEYRRIRLDSRTGSMVIFLDLDEKKFFEVSSEMVPREMKIGELGIMVTFNGKEKVFRMTPKESHREGPGILP